MVVVFVGIILIVSFLKKENYYTDTFFAMDTFFEIGIPRETNNKEEIIEKARSLVSYIDGKLNSYNPNSEISGINKYGYRQSIEVSPETVEILKKALFYGNISRGLFDVTFEPLQNLYGFDAQNFRIPSKEEIEKAKKFVNYKFIQVNDESLSVRLLKEGVKINLSGIIKGYTLDKVSDFLLKEGISEYYLNFGGNILIKGAPKKIGVKHPRKDDILFKVQIENSSISTSADYQQYFEKDGKRFTHIVNPENGRVDFPWQAVVAISKNGIDADFLSTYIFVAGKENGKSIIYKYFPGSGFIFIEDEERVFKFNIFK